MVSKTTFYSKRIIYTLILLSVPILLMEIWYITNVPNIRTIGYLYWEGALAFILFLMGMLLSFDYIKKGKGGNYFPKGMLVVFGILLFDVFVMINLTPQVVIDTDLDRLTFYYHLMLSAALVLNIVLIGNVSRIEKKKDEGFNIYIHDPESWISTKMIIPTWLASFGLTGLFVTVLGSVMVAYPKFSLLSGFGVLFSPMLSSFPIGDSENVIFMFVAFAFSFWILRKSGVPSIPNAFVSIIIASLVFVGYHSFVYGSNDIALIVVFSFAFISIAMYRWSKSMVIPSGMHVGNNFFGALFQKSVFGLSVVGENGTTNGDPSFAIAMVITTIVIMSAVVWYFGKKKKGAKKR